MVISLYLAFVWVVASDVLHPVAIATTTTSTVGMDSFAFFSEMPKSVSTATFSPAFAKGDLEQVLSRLNMYSNRKGR